MKYFFAILLVLISCNIFAKKKSKAKLVTITGHITQTSDYCGGAMPNPELLQNLATPAPFAGKEIYIKIGAKNKGGTPVYKKVVADENGRFAVKLNAGTTYCFMEDWKAKPFKVPQNTEFMVWDRVCLYERYLQGDLVLKVNKFNNPIITINYHLPCFYKPYCGKYSGPLPP